MTLAPRERIVQFGYRQGLAGILTTPRAARGPVPHVVLVNAGIVHRVGPSRLYVDIARTLAAKGYPVLRFDLSGLGDSEAVSRGASVSEAAISDIKTALEFLETSRKATSFIIGGLCAGADYGMLATFEDPRIVGTVLIEPTVARTRRSELIHIGRRLRRPATWVALLTLRHPMLRRLVDRVRKPTVIEPLPAPVERGSSHETKQPTVDEICASLQRVIDRGVELMFVFTGGETDYYNYRDQLFDLLPGFDFRQQLQLEYMPETDHTVSDDRGRERLLGAMEGWITERFPVAEAERELA